MASIRLRTWQTASGAQREAWVCAYIRYGKQHIRTFHSENEARQFRAQLSIVDRYDRPTPHKVESLRVDVLSLYEINRLPVIGTISMSGIYFLLQEEILQYVGQSQNVASRTRKHKAEKKIDFTVARLLQADLRDLDVLEHSYIREYDPAYNRGVRGRRAKRDDNGPRFDPVTGQGILL
jgi:hypothetical protein